MIDKRKGMLLTVTVIAALAAGGAAVASAGGGDRGDDDATYRPISGAALERARAVALGETGGGRVTETEVGDEEGAYEVEVTRPDGSQVDVHLDEAFSVLGSAGDDDAPGEADASDED